MLARLRGPRSFGQGSRGGHRHIGAQTGLFFLVADQCLLGSGAQGASGKDTVVDIGPLVLKPDLLFLETNLCRMPVCPCSLGCCLNQCMVGGGAGLSTCSRCRAVCNSLPMAPQPCNRGPNALRRLPAQHQQLCTSASAWCPTYTGPDQTGCHEQATVNIRRGGAGELKHQPAFLSQLTALPMLPK